MGFQSITKNEKSHRFFENKTWSTHIIQADTENYKSPTLIGTKIDAFKVCKICLSSIEQLRVV